MHGRSPLLRLQSDERLIALVRRGNHHAFEALVARYQSRLLAFCRHMLSSKEDAEDVLQEVFAAAFNAILADDRAINVRPVAVPDRAQPLAEPPAPHAGRRRRLDGRAPVRARADDGRQGARREEFRLLIADVQELPETQRTALLLREIDALSYEQIAEAMETTVPSVKSLLVRARVSLAEAAEARLLSCEEVRDRARRGRRGAGAHDRAGAPPPAHLRPLRDLPQAAAPDQQGARRALPGRPAAAAQEVARSPTWARARRPAAAPPPPRVAPRGAAGGAAMQAGLSTLATKTVAGLAAAAIVTAGAVEVKHVAHKTRDKAAVMAAAPAVVPPAAAAAAPPAAPAPVQPRSAGDTYKPDHKAGDKADKADPKPEATATATATPTATPSTEQHDSATTELPSETTGSTEDGGGVIAPPTDSGAPVGTVVLPSPTPTGSPQPAPTPTPTGPTPTPTPSPSPEPSPTATPSPAPSPTPTPGP